LAAPLTGREGAGSGSKMPWDEDLSPHLSATLTPCLGGSRPVTPRRL
jgi:hypothetical protein